MIDIDGRMLEYELTRKKVKNLNLRVRSDGTVCVSAAKGVPQYAIDAFIRANGERVFEIIRRNSSRAEEQARRAEPTYSDGDSVLILGKRYKIRNVWGNVNSGRIDEENGELIIETSDPGCPELRRRTAEYIMDQMGRKAVLDACQRIYPTFQSRDIPYPEIKFRKMKSQWGNCRPDKGRLTFNTRLSSVSEYCIELVVAHEFTHFLHRDHSDNFYSSLSGIIPDHKERKRQLRAFEKELAMTR